MGYACALHVPQFPFPVPTVPLQSLGVPQHRSQSVVQAIARCICTSGARTKVYVNNACVSTL